MDLNFRVAEASDEAFMREMLYLALFVPPGAPALPKSALQDPAIARYVQNWGTGPADYGLIALVDGLPVGAAWLRLFPISDPGYGFVDESTPELSIAILPAYRGKGIGSQLLNSLLREGLPVSLSCDPANPAYRLYLRLGFKPLPNIRTMRRIG